MATRQTKRAASTTPRAVNVREKIVTAALALIEQEGLEAFSTRKLAAKLGMKVMSLYHYFNSREELLDAAVDSMITELRLPNVARVGWRRGLLSLAQEYRAMGHRHLQAVPVLSQRCPSSQTMQEFLGTINSLLLKAGLSQEAAVEWLNIQRDYVFGSLAADYAEYILSNEHAATKETKGSKTGNRYCEPRPKRNRELVFKKGFNSMLDAIEREI